MKIVSVSQLLGCPLFGSNSGLFTVPGFIVSLVGIKKKKKEKEKKKKKKKEKEKKGRRDIKGKKEGIEQERRKEEEGVERKIIKNNNNKELLKKKKFPAGFKLANQFCWSFVCCRLRGA